jgi:UDP-glucose 4-epimerase
MGDPIKLYGDGSELRDHLFIEDLVQIVRHLVQSDEGGIYNLASGVSRTYQDMLSIIHAVVKKEFEVAHEGRTRPQVDQTVDVSHLKQVVPGLRLTSLEQGIRETFLDMEQRLPEEARH